MDLTALRYFAGIIGLISTWMPWRIFRGMLLPIFNFYFIDGSLAFVLMIFVAGCLLTIFTSRGSLLMVLGIVYFYVVSPLSFNSLGTNSGLATGIFATVVGVTSLLEMNLIKKDI